MVGAIAEYFLQVCRLRSPLYGGDIDLAIIADTIGLLAIQHLLNDPGERDRFSSLDALVGERQRSCNALSIAAATGLPRETVRRKLKHLIDLDILERRADGGYVYRAGVLLDQPHREIIARVEEATIHFFNQCLADGTVRIAPLNMPVALA